MYKFESIFKIQALPRVNIAIFASGSGSNADKILSYFSGHSSIKVALIVCNRKEAGVWQIAENHGVKCCYSNKTSLYESNDIISLLQEEGIDWIILAGFLLKIPNNILESYPDKIINIHPALLPKFGGKGMYGLHVHKAVVAANESETGITIHLVNENYDEGRVIAQFSTPVSSLDSAEDVQKKVQQLEHQYFPKSIENYILEN